MHHPPHVRILVLPLLNCCRSRACEASLCFSLYHGMRFCFPSVCFCFPSVCFPSVCFPSHYIREYVFVFLPPSHPLSCVVSLLLKWSHAPGARWQKSFVTRLQGNACGQAPRLPRFRHIFGDQIFMASHLEMEIEENVPWWIFSHECVCLNWVTGISYECSETPSPILYRRLSNEA